MAPHASSSKVKYEDDFDIDQMLNQEASELTREKEVPFPVLLLHSTAHYPVLDVSSLGRLQAQSI